MTGESTAVLRSSHDDATLSDVDAVNRRIDDLEKLFVEAFPGGDHVGHCRYHALMIEDLSERKKLRQAVMEKTVAGLVWAVMLGLGIACWKYLMSLLGRGT